eukprot:scaffold9132_cov84-Skeletonema_dohrnii-CCMP3373.AAC.4
MASTAGLLISILTPGWCFTWNLYFFVPRRHILPSLFATGFVAIIALSIVSATVESGGTPFSISGDADGGE